MWPSGERGNVFDIRKDACDNLFKFCRDTISEEAVIANDTEVRREDMLDEFEDELFSRETAKRFGLASLLIEEGNELAVVVSDSCLS